MIIKIATPQTVQQMGHRTNQEDALYPQLGEASTDDYLFIVCDGMGGHDKGEVASNTVCAAISAYLAEHFQPDAPLNDRLLLSAVDAAYLALDAKDDGAPKRMGTTLTLLCLHRGGVTVAYIGDSRVYHVRPSEGRVCMQTRDHSLVYDLYQAGEISYNEMATHPRKNVITKAMQPGGDYRVLPDIIHITDVRPDDYFYLCSDGMLERMSNGRIVSIFAAQDSDEEKAQRLIDETDGNADNHTAIFFRVLTVTAEPGDGSLFVNDEHTSRYNAVNIVPAVLDVELDAEQAAPAPPPYVQSAPSAAPARAAAPTPAAYRTPPPATQRSRTTLLYILGAVVVAIAVFLLMFVLRGASDEKETAPDNTTTIITLPEPEVKTGVNAEENEIGREVGKSDVNENAPDDAKVDDKSDGAKDNTGKKEEQPTPKQVQDAENLLKEKVVRKVEHVIARP